MLSNNIISLIFSTLGPEWFLDAILFVNEVLNSTGRGGIRCQRTSRYGVFAKINSQVTDGGLGGLCFNKCICNRSSISRVFETLDENVPPDHKTDLEASSETSRL